MKLFNSKLLASLLVVSAFSMSSASFATIVSVGDLNYDTNTQIITGNGKDYLGFGVGRSWDYATTLSMTSATGAYSDFSIATTRDADFFIGSLYGSTATSCSTTDGIAQNISCGALAFVDNSFGYSYDSYSDYVWFMADESPTNEVGLVGLFSTLTIQYDSWNSVDASDYYTNIGWLLVRDSATVPEPNILALMGLGIFGLGLARRKIKK